MDQKTMNLPIEIVDHIMTFVSTKMSEMDDDDLYEELIKRGVSLSMHYEYSVIEDKDRGYLTDYWGSYRLHREPLGFEEWYDD